MRDEVEKDYQFCVLDGRKEKVGNFRVEPPGLFRGRGEHPKKGTHKFRLRPEDITINIGKDAPVPKPNVPGKWKAVRRLVPSFARPSVGLDPLADPPLLANLCPPAPLAGPARPEGDVARDVERERQRQHQVRLPRGRLVAQGPVRHGQV